MLFTISPADFNYEETISTLNIAIEAKKIKTNAEKVTDDPKVKFILRL